MLTIYNIINFVSEFGYSKADLINAKIFLTIDKMGNICEVGVDPESKYWELYNLILDSKFKFIPAESESGEKLQCIFRLF